MATYNEKLIHELIQTREQAVKALESVRHAERVLENAKSRAETALKEFKDKGTDGLYTYKNYLIKRSTVAYQTEPRLRSEVDITEVVHIHEEPPVKGFSPSAS